MNILVDDSRNAGEERNRLVEVRIFPFQKQKAAKNSTIAYIVKKGHSAVISLTEEEDKGYMSVFVSTAHL